MLSGAFYHEFNSTILYISCYGSQNIHIHPDMTLKAGIDFQRLYTQWIISGNQKPDQLAEKTAAHTADCRSLPEEMQHTKCTEKKRLQNSHVNKYDISNAKWCMF